MENIDSLSGYSLEYSTALLMNLCLHKEARDICSGQAKEVVNLMKELLNSQHNCCLVYINGIMYSLLTDLRINSEALQCKLANDINKQLNLADGELRKQFEVILKLHQQAKGQDSFVQDTCDPNTEPNEEYDILEPEIELDDPVNSYLSGEDFLLKYKLLFPSILEI